MCNCACRPLELMHHGVSRGRWWHRERSGGVFVARLRAVGRVVECVRQRRSLCRLGQNNLVFFGIEFASHALHFTGDSREGLTRRGLHH
jgi:hypothetical protein